jgi:exopolysaccharide biosynthesis polyprenyl glycosylphosphotransferase
MYKQYHRYKLFVMFADVFLTVSALAVVIKLRPYLPGEHLEPGQVLPDPSLFLMVAFLWHVLFAMTGVYALDRISSLSKQFGRFTTVNFLAVLLFAGLLFFSFRETSRMLVIYFGMADYMVLLLLRYGVTVYLLRYYKNSKPSSVLIAGVSESGIALADTIVREHGAVLKIAGFVDDVPSVDRRLPAPLLGGMGNIASIIRDNQIDLVVIALPENRAPEANDLVFKLEALEVRVYLIPDMISMAVLNAEVERFGNLVIIGIREPAIQGHRRITKRIMDLAASLLVLLITWPLLIAIWIAIRLDSPGSALFMAKRVGENGRVFEMYKFRTMFVDADKHQAEVAAETAEGRKIYKIKDDPRVTRVGKWLRRWSLDELPQLFNVIKGEMSLVGPRPEQPFITQEYDHWQWQRLLVPPGVTGWWQISGRSDLPMHLNTQYDIYYVRNFSLFLDLKILFKTLAVVLQGKGAY